MNKEAQRLLVVTTLLICIGIVMIYSSSSSYAYEKFQDSAYYLKRHMANFIIGLIFAFFVMRLDYRKIKKITKPLIILSIFSLVLVFIPGIGREAGGARRWVRFGPVGFQPSEFAGLFLIIYLADILERKQHCIKSFFYGFMPPFIVSAFTVLLVLLQPDLGNAVIFFTLLIIMFFVAGVNMLYFLPFIIAFVPALYFLIIRVPYRLRRIIGYLDPWGDAQGAGFQIVQSFLALGSGGIFGIGLGCSRQKLFYLPQGHTDFVFSIIGEELGLIGTLGIVILFGAFVWLGTMISLKAEDLFAKLLAIGITVSIGLKAIINIAVSTGAIPTKGLPLPFVSYGGTALIFNMVGVSLLLSITKR